MIARANPKLLDEEKSGPLFAAVLRTDYRLLEMLLKYGADPNAEMLRVDDPESFYDWAETDYWIYVCEGRYSEDPTDEDNATKESWLEYLDRLAIKYEKLRPDYLKLLRRYELRHSESWSESTARG